MEKDMIQQYESLYKMMEGSGNPSKMKVFGNAEKWAFAQISKTHPEIAKHWLSKIEAVRWYNYLCENEANEIVSKFVNQDGSEGGKWSMQEIASVVKTNGGKMREEPYYNEYALYATMNMLASDHWESVSAFVAEDTIPTFIYSMALEKLKDVDHKEFVRPYFKV
jgi:hypothetical protein